MGSTMDVPTNYDQRWWYGHPTINAIPQKMTIPLRGDGKHAPISYALTTAHMLMNITNWVDGSFLVRQYSLDPSIPMSLSCH